MIKLINIVRDGTNNVKEVYVVKRERFQNGIVHNRYYKKIIIRNPIENNVIDAFSINMTEK